MKLSQNASIILLIMANIAIDQISKVIVRGNITKGEEISIIGDKFLLMNVENTGAFLGMGSDLNPTVKLIFLMIIPVIVLSYLVYYIFKNKSSLDNLSFVALCCIAGGGIANVFDRIVFGKVTDFLHLDFGGVFRTGIFNIADVSVTAGMIMLLFSSFLIKKKPQNA